jgi:chromosome segregation ATPase
MMEYKPDPELTLAMQGGLIKILEDKVDELKRQRDELKETLELVITTCQKAESELIGCMKQRDEQAARIAELEAERDKYRKQVQLGFKHLMETPVLTDETIEEGYTVVEHLRMALAKALDERDALQAEVERYAKQIDAAMGEKS